MAKNNQISFLIDHIDPLGQGVFKKDADIYFIPKTLPGEEGVAKILKSKKNIHFCEVVEINVESNTRINPECPHFNQCPGCHFLHTDYKSEIDFKSQSFKRMLSTLGEQDFEVIKAPERLHYRNRVQLHYSKKENRIGFIKGKSNSILEVPNCKIYLQELKSEFRNVVQNWKSILPKKSPPKGHIEIYLHPKGNINVSWNKRYAQSGFSQVNRSMNKAMLDELEIALSSLNSKSCLDLFGGDGNLSRALRNGEHVEHIDIYNTPPGEHFHSINLMEDDALSEFQKVSSSSFDLFIVDPPRAGFKNLAQWAQEFEPKHIAYISCHPQTMIRDLKELGDSYKVQKSWLMDLFPSTFHFEAMTLLERA